MLPPPARLGAWIAAARDAVVPARGWLGPRSAVANSAAVAKRSAGSLASATCTASSTCGGIVLRCTMSDRGSSVTTRAMIAWAEGPVKGGSPKSISYVTQPSAYTSERGVISRSPIACSGLM